MRRAETILYPEVAIATKAALHGPPPLKEKELVEITNALLDDGEGTNQQNISLYASGVRRMGYYMARTLFYHPQAPHRIRTWALDILRSHQPKKWNEVTA